MSSYIRIYSEYLQCQLQFLLGTNESPSLENRKVDDAIKAYAE